MEARATLVKSNMKGCTLGWWKWPIKWLLDGRLCGQVFHASLIPRDDVEPLPNGDLVIGTVVL